MSVNIDELVYKYLQGHLTPEEKHLLDSWLQASPENRLWFEEWKNATRMEEKMRRMAAIDREKGWQRMVNKGVVKGERQPEKVVRWRRWMAAASVLILLMAGIYFWNNSTTQVAFVVDAPIKDIPAGKNGAILTLADGSQVSLDTFKNATIALQGGISVKVVNGSLVYEGKGDMMGYNTTTTPKGRQFQLILPDGTQVWLNAASSIRYPTTFTGNKRLVEVTGEVYFEVVKDSEKPFLVNVNRKTEVEVLGTHFNVNAYENENSINTTLLEGSVAVAVSANIHQKKILQPGQQAQVQVDQQAQPGITVVNNADIEKVLAWKNGLFDFNGLTFEEIMRQLERWYDIEIDIDNGLPDIQLAGTMSKQVSLERVLRFFDKADIHYRLEGRKLTILP